MIITLLENLFSSDHIEECQKKDAATPDEETQAVLTSANVKTIVPSQFKDDVESLKAYVGAENWIDGLRIELSLQELLTICPRERRRSDAYKKLIKYLADELQIELIIKQKGINHA